jgi:lipopolysaccharide export system permease protein
MKIIHRYILKEMMMPILFGISLFTFIFLIDIMVQMMENIIVKGVSFLDMVRILSFYLPPILSQTIPMGFFLGVMISYSKLTSTSESTAMNAMGMSLNSIIKPAFMLAIGITAFIFFLQEAIIPNSFVKLQQLTLKIAYEKPSFQLKENMFVDNIDDYSIYIDTVDKSEGAAKNIIIFKKEKDSPFPTVVTSKKTTWKDAAMILEDAEFYNLDETGSEKLRGKFSKQRIPISSFFENVKIKVDEIETMAVRTLLKELKTKEGKEKAPYLVEINKKLAIPLSAIMLGVLGVLFSVGHHRSGKGVSYGLSLGIIFLYIASLNVGVVMATRGKVSAFWGVWTPDFILLGLTLFMYRIKRRKG